MATLFLARFVIIAAMPTAQHRQLRTLLKSIDRHIAEVESMMLTPLSDENLRRVMRRLADLEASRLKAQSTLNTAPLPR